MVLIPQDSVDEPDVADDASMADAPSYSLRPFLLFFVLVSMVGFWIYRRRSQ